MNTRLEVKPKLQSLKNNNESSFDLVIIGGGPAGLTAAIYALRSFLNTALVEKMVIGGVASTAYLIENYPGFPEGISGLDLCQKMHEQALKLGLKEIWGAARKITRQDNIFAIDIDGKIITAKAVILATGSEAARLNIPGEKEFRGKGVSYCATCDGPFYKDKNIIVVGGGNAAIEEAIFLTRFAKKVTIIHRRDELRADPILSARAKNHPQIYFFWHSVIEEIIGDKVVKEVLLKDLAGNKLMRVPADGVFVYVGSSPNSGLVKETAKLDRKGFIITDEKMQTSAKGIMAAGDVRTKSLRQIITAAADGALAAETARAYIENKKA